MLGALSILLLAAGAILAFATNTTVSEVNIDAVGWILMAVGAIGLLMWAAFLASFAPFAGTRGGDQHITVDHVDRTDHRI